MHEVSIAQALVSTIEQAAHEAGLTRVTRMNVELGPQAGVTPDALSFALELAGDGTLTQGAAVVYSGPGAEEHDHDHEEHEHTHTHEAGLSPAEAMERWTVRLAWIEGT
jgi:Zn finger protein HypA/HybF involved in hydrogenase expression